MTHWRRSSKPARSSSVWLTSMRRASTILSIRPPSIKTSNKPTVKEVSVTSDRVSSNYDPRRRKYKTATKRSWLAVTSYRTNLMWIRHGTKAQSKTLRFKGCLAKSHHSLVLTRHHISPATGRPSSRCLIWLTSSNTITRAVPWTAQSQTRSAGFLSRGRITLCYKALPSKYLEATSRSFSVICNKTGT